MKKIIFSLIIIVSLQIVYSQSGCLPDSLVYPPNGSTIYDLHPTLQWVIKGTNFLYHRVQVDTTGLFMYPLINQYVPNNATSYTINSGLQFNRTYYWRTGVYCYPGFWSNSYTFTFWTSLTGINIISSEIPKSFSLHQNYPNPFNPVTKIRFDIPSLVRRSAGVVVLKVYDLLGREVATLVNSATAELKPGIYEVEWDGSNYASGVYFYSLITSEFTETKKLILLK